MDTTSIAAPPEQGTTPSARTVSIKLRGGETGGSIMMFEQSLPVGTKSTLHLHRDCDEVAYIVSGELTSLVGDEVSVGGPGTCAFMPRGMRHAWKATGAETARVLFLYTPAKAGGLIEEQERTGRKFNAMNQHELADILERHGWELFGPSPL
jgi:quercetin dioxygenase-like cupin family protein